MCDAGTSSLEYVQAVGTILALVFSGLALFTSAGERKRLRRRLQHERLEDLAIAIAHTRDSIRRLDALDAERDLSEIRARVAALPRSSHPEAWAFAEAEFDPNEPFIADVRDRLTKHADAAQRETHGALTKSVASLD